MLSQKVVEDFEVESLKEALIRMMHSLPDDCTVEDVQSRLSMIQKSRRGLERLEKEGVTQEEAEMLMGKWLVG